MPVRAGQCLVCGVSIARREGAGRPAQYCGEEHRRAAEYQLRRVQSLLARAEKKAQDAGLVVLQVSSYRRAWAETARDYWNDEVGRLRAELDALLAGQVGLRAVNEDAS